jgi:hypothetical protein
MFPDLRRVLREEATWIDNLALDLEAGRVSIDQAMAIADRKGIQIAEAAYKPCRPNDTSTSVSTQPEVLDPVATWQRLPPEVRVAIGAAAIAACVGFHGADIAIDQADPAARRPRSTAGVEALALLMDYVGIYVLGGEESTLPPRPDLHPLGIRQCRACGCTDNFACDGGCSWIETDLCSACVPAAPGD